MISLNNVTKSFEDKNVISNLTCNIQRGQIFGIVGINGAGKSTLMRLLSGIYSADSGDIKIDNESVYNNSHVKERIAFVPDDLYFIPGADIDRMCEYYMHVRDNFDTNWALDTALKFRLNYGKPITSFSKGMKRQAAIILALASKPDVLLLDETFDGLDPIAKSAVKKLIADEIINRQMTVIITSHSLRELEDLCDRLGLLYNNSICLEADASDLKTSMFKIQLAFDNEISEKDIKTSKEFDILSFQKQGQIVNVIAKGDKEAAHETMLTLKPILINFIPLTLEEVFTLEMRQRGYNLDKVVGGID